jgi:hypothetical protein
MPSSSGSSALGGRPRATSFTIAMISRTIAVVGSGDTFEQVADRRADLRLGVVFIIEMKLI